jgi:calcium-dependent protein kinase
MLKEEFYIFQITHHPNIVRLFDIFHDEKSFYLVQGLCSGGELEDQMGTLRLDANYKYLPEFREKHCATIVVELLYAIRYLHGIDIVHRDLKCANVLLTNDLDCDPKDISCKIADFGFAT